MNANIPENLNAPAALLGAWGMRKIGAASLNTDVKGPFFAILIINDTIFTTLKSSGDDPNDDDFTAITYKAGTVLTSALPFNLINVDSGAVWAYYAPGPRAN